MLKNKARVTKIDNGLVEEPAPSYSGTEVASGATNSVPLEAAEATETGAISAGVVEAKVM